MVTGVGLSVQIKSTGEIGRVVEVHYQLPPFKPISEMTAEDFRAQRAATSYTILTNEGGYYMREYPAADVELL